MRPGLSSIPQVPLLFSTFPNYSLHVIYLWGFIYRKRTMLTHPMSEIVLELSYWVFAICFVLRLLFLILPGGIPSAHIVGGRAGGGAGGLCFPWCLHWCTVGACLGLDRDKNPIFIICILTLGSSCERHCCNLLNLVDSAFNAMKKTSRFYSFKSILLRWLLCRVLYW